MKAGIQGQRETKGNEGGGERRTRKKKVKGRQGSGMSKRHGLGRGNEDCVPVARRQEEGKEGGG